MATKEPRRKERNETNPGVDKNLKMLIAFDLHHVVVKPNRLSMIMSVIFFPYILHVLVYLLFHPRALIGLIIELFTFQHPEKILRKSRITQYKPLINWLSPLFEKIVNSQALDSGVIRIIDKLKANGHEICLFSNIGEEHLVKLIERLPIMNVKFDGFQATSHALDYLKKRDMPIWNSFITKFNLLEDKRNVLLIDDKLKNILTAKRLGFDGIVYTTPVQLRRELISRKLIK